MSALQAALTCLDIRLQNFAAVEITFKVIQAQVQADSITCTI